MRVFRRLMLTAALLSMALWAPTQAQQNVPDASKMQIELGVPGIYVVPISATAAINTQTTMTIPAPPPGMFNYICKLEFNMAQNATSTAATNATTSTTNFNSWAWKFSLAATANINYDKSWDFGTPGAGCAKSTSPGVATTFVSPTALAQATFTWSATYYQGK